MSYAYSPENIARYYKQATNDRQKHVQQVFTPACQVQQGIVLEQCKRDNKCKKFQNSFSVNGQWITAEFPAAVSKDIHEFKTFGREKTKPGIYQEKPGKNNRSADNHKNQSNDPVKTPVNTG